MTATPPSLDALDTFPKLLLHNAANWPDSVAMREKDLGVWSVYTWADYRDRVREIALGLADLGFARGEVAALLGRNRPNWVWCELATHSLGGMTLGVYADVLAEEAGYLLAFAGVSVVFAEDEEQVDKLLELKDRIPSVRHIVFHDDRGMRKYADPRLVSWERLVARGRDSTRASPGGSTRRWRGAGLRRGGALHHLGHDLAPEAGDAPVRAVPGAPDLLPRGRSQGA
jgi:long-chain acyl-CoA synthetase